MTRKQRSRILELAQAVKTGAEVTESEVAEVLALAEMPATGQPLEAADRLLGDYHAERGIFEPSKLRTADTDEKPA